MLRILCGIKIFRSLFSSAQVTTRVLLKIALRVLSHIQPRSQGFSLEGALGTRLSCIYHEILLNKVGQKEVEITKHILETGIERAAKNIPLSKVLEPHFFLTLNRVDDSKPKLEINDRFYHRIC